jgi:hypothetical protein
MLMKVLHQSQHLNELAAPTIPHPRFHQPSPFVQRRGLIERLHLSCIASPDVKHVIGYNGFEDSDNLVDALIPAPPADRLQPDDSRCRRNGRSRRCSPVRPASDSSRIHVEHDAFRRTATMDGIDPTAGEISKSRKGVSADARPVCAHVITSADESLP